MLQGIARLARSVGGLFLALLVLFKIASVLGTARTLPGDIAPIVQTLSPIAARIATIPDWLFWSAWVGVALLLIALSWALERQAEALSASRLLGATRIDQIPTMTFSQVLQHVAIKSSWSGRSCPDGGASVDATDHEVHNALSIPGRLIAYGIWRESSDNKKHGRTEMPLKFWERGEYDGRKMLMCADPPTHAWTRNTDTERAHAYDDVVFERERVLRLWPTRHLLLRIIRPSPFIRWRSSLPLDQRYVPRDYGQEAFDELFGKAS